MRSIPNPRPEECGDWNPMEERGTRMARLSGGGAELPRANSILGCVSRFKIYAVGYICLSVPVLSRKKSDAEGGRIFVCACASVRCCVGPVMAPQFFGEGDFCILRRPSCCGYKRVRPVSGISPRYSRPISEKPIEIHSGSVTMAAAHVAMVMCTDIFGNPPKCFASTAAVTPHGARAWNTRSSLSA